MKRWMLLMLAVFALTSCNTMIGLGRDMRQLGEGMENKAHGRTFDGRPEDTQQSGNLPTY